MRELTGEIDINSHLSVVELTFIISVLYFSILLFANLKIQTNQIDIHKKLLKDKIE